MTSDLIPTPKADARDTMDEGTQRVFFKTYEQLHRFGALANAGGVAACLGFLSATSTTDGVVKATLLPLGFFVSGILAVWICIFPLLQKLIENPEDKVRKGPVLTRKIADFMTPHFVSGALFLAPLTLFCLGVATSFLVVLFS